MGRVLKINPRDSVAVVVCEALAAGEEVEVDGRHITLRECVERGHKFALEDMKAGEAVIKYGYPIGHLMCDVSSGEWIHTHNLQSDLCDNLSYVYAPQIDAID